MWLCNLIFWLPHLGPVSPKSFGALQRRAHWRCFFPSGGAAGNSGTPGSWYQRRQRKSVWFLTNKVPEFLNTGGRGYASGGRTLTSVVVGPARGGSTSPAASTPRTLRRPRLHAPPPSQTHTRAQRVLGPVHGGSTALRPDNDGTAGRRGALTHHPPTNTPTHTGAARSHASQPHAAVVVRPQPHRAPPSRRPWTSARRIHRAPPRQRRDCGAR